MKKSIQISIPEPCHEDWSKMTPTQKGKHCATCNKEVIDFTKVTDEYLYKTASNGGSLCGRFTKSQLNRPIQLQRKEGKSWANYAASLLIPAAILSTQDIKAQGQYQRTEQIDTSYTSLEISSLTRVKEDSLSRKHTKNDTLKKKDIFTTKGTISDIEGPVPFASVYIKGTKKNVIADENGMYEIEVTTGDIIVFNSLGYKDLEMTVINKRNIDVFLEYVEIIITGKLRMTPSKNTP